MVNFSVFNELSLPLNEHQAVANFGKFFELLAKLKKRRFNQIRMNNDFKSYSILENTNFQQFIGQQTNRDFRTRLKSFVNNAIVKIDTPIIKDDDLEQGEQQNSCEYFYKQQSTNGGLACCDIWDTLAVSFNTDEHWNKPYISIQKTQIINDAIVENEISIKHASLSDHLNEHQSFFKNIESENKLNITQDNFWENRDKNFPEILKFCPEIENQIKRIDKIIFQQAVSILRDIETKRKLVTDFNHSGESQTVCNNPTLKNMRMFSIEGEKEFFQNHIKSLPNKYRIYFIEKDEKTYIGYIGKHLAT
ncbi:MAG: hypothetical protein HFP81_06895 [Methylococcales symbiont of Hymedesmia sp. n. MRB-2018]|nr:MAG: hypothetical protein HFP81_06895 [Methylococcales symbiont of Hymedesmia sp. n. MRB-2018]